MTVRTRILETTAGLLAESADVDVSTRAICDAAGVTAPTLYHHFGDKDGLLAAVVDFGWAAFLKTKLAVAAVVHDHVADDIRAGWDNHLEFARENPSFYKLMWSPGLPLTAERYARRTRCSTTGWSWAPAAAAAHVGGGCVAHCPVRDHWRRAVADLTA